jgi:acetate kinase
VRFAHGVVDRIGSEEATLALDGEDHIEKAVAEVLGVLRSLSMGEIEAIGYRVVHGGDRFVAPALLDDAVVAALADLSDLAPLHNPPAVEVIHAARDALSHVPMVASFDTPFDMVVLNRISRYHLAIEALRRVPRLRSRAGGIIDGFNEGLAAHSAYLKEHGADMPEITKWTWSS